jgi:hypothetical protein
VQDLACTTYPRGDAAGIRRTGTTLAEVAEFPLRKQRFWWLGAAKLPAKDTKPKGFAP